MDENRIKNNINCIILCGGKGSRMSSDKAHKVCFEIAGVPAIKRLMRNLKEAGIEKFDVVVGVMPDKVISCISEEFDDVLYIYQKSPLGTGHAALTAINALRKAGITGPVLIVMGDKIIDKEVIKNLIQKFESGNADAIITIQPKSNQPGGGRIVIDDEGRVRGICEEIDAKKALVYKKLYQKIENGSLKDMSMVRKSIEEIVCNLIPRQKMREKILQSIYSQIDCSFDELIHIVAENMFVELGNQKFDPEIIEDAIYVNTATYLFSQEALIYSLDRITSQNAQNEIYLTDAFNILANNHFTNGKAFKTDAMIIENKHQIMTFNTVDELLEIESYFIGKENASQYRISFDMLKPVSEWLKLFTQMPPAMIDQFKEIYGEDEALIEERKKLYIEVLNFYKNKYGENRSVIISRAPGRANLMGRHVEHRGGSVNVISINKEVIAVASPRDDDVVNISNVDSNFEDRSFKISENLPDLSWKDWVSYIESDEIKKMISNSKGDWVNYVKAAVLKLQYTFKDVRLKGMDMAFSGDIPMAAGLSSSSAVIVATAEAAVVINNIDISVQKFVDLCGEGEWFVGSRGGAADHAAMKFGNRGYIAHLGFFPFGFRKAINFPEGYKLIIANSHVKAQKSSNAKDLFNQRVASYEFGFMMIKELYPEYASKLERLRDINLDNLGVLPSRIYEMLLKLPEKVKPEELFEILPKKYHDRINQIMSSHAKPNYYIIRSVILYGIAECQRSKMCPEILEKGDFETFGKLMEISHNGDRVAVLKDGKMQEYDYSASDKYLAGLINNLKSENPEKVLNAQIEMQPGGYACSTPEIDFMVDTVKKIPGVIGAQLSGAGLGGCIMILVKDDEVDELISVLENEYYKPRGLKSGILIVRPVKGSMVWRY